MNSNPFDNDGGDRPHYYKTRPGWTNSGVDVVCTGQRKPGGHAEVFIAHYDSTPGVVFTDGPDKMADDYYYPQILLTRHNRKSGPAYQDAPPEQNTSNNADTLRCPQCRANVQLTAEQRYPALDKVRAEGRQTVDLSAIL